MWGFSVEWGFSVVHGDWNGFLGFTHLNGFWGLLIWLELMNNFIIVEQTIMRRPFTPQYSQKYPQAASVSRGFPEDISCVFRSMSLDHGSIFISNLEAANNPNTLARHRIGAVLTCAKGHKLDHSKDRVPYYLYIPGIDHQSYDLSVHFEEAVDFIHAHLPLTNVLVHCIAGVSRSASMVIAYLIREHSMSLSEAYRKIRAQRSKINPNDGFVRLLKEYELEISDSSRAKGRGRSGMKQQRDMQFTPYQEDKGIPIISPTMKKTQGNKNKKSVSFSGRPFQAITPEKKQVGNRREPERAYSNSLAKTSKVIEEKPFQSPNGNTMKSSSRQRSNPEIPKSGYTAGYFQSLNSELEDKIQKIKKKYDIQRSQLQDKYQPGKKYESYGRTKTNAVNNYQDFDYDPTYASKFAYLTKMKTDSSQIDPYVDKNRSSYGYDKEKAVSNRAKIEDLFPSSFYMDKQRKQIYQPRKSPKKGIITTNTLLKQKLDNGYYQQKPVYTHYQPNRSHNKMMINNSESLALKNKHYH